MSFDELWDTECFMSKKYLEKDLDKLVNIHFVVQKLDIYYITELGGNFLAYFPNWKLKQLIIMGDKMGRIY